MGEEPAAEFDEIATRDIRSKREGGGVRRGRLERGVATGKEEKYSLASSLRVSDERERGEEDLGEEEKGERKRKRISLSERKV